MPSKHILAVQSRAILNRSDKSCSTSNFPNMLQDSTGVNYRSGVRTGYRLCYYLPIECQDELHIIWIYSSVIVSLQLKQNYKSIAGEFDRSALNVVSHIVPCGDVGQVKLVNETTFCLYTSLSFREISSLLVSQFNMIFLT